MRDSLNQFDGDNDIQIVQLYALCVEGGEFHGAVSIVDKIEKARFFRAKEEALKYREIFDPWLHVRSKLVNVVLTYDIEPEEDYD